MYNRGGGALGTVISESHSLQQFTTPAVTAANGDDIIPEAWYSRSFPCSRHKVGQHNEYSMAGRHTSTNCWATLPRNAVALSTDGIFSASFIAPKTARHNLAPTLV